MGAAGAGDLGGAVLLVPTPDDPEQAGTWSLVARDVVTTLLDEDDAGLLMVACTDVAALERWRPDGGCYVERPASWFFGVASADPEGRVVIDPGSPSSVRLGPAEVAALAAGVDPGAAGDPPDRSSPPSSMLLATPSEPLDAAVTEAIATALAAQQSAVRGARLFAVDDDGTGLRPLVMVELAEDVVDVDAAMGAIVQAVADRTDAAAGLSFAVVTPEWRSTFDAGGIPLHP